jgi:hypothetical protein
MFNNIKHKDQGIMLARLESVVKGANMDSVYPRVFIIHKCRVSFDSLHIAKPAEKIEEEPVATANVKYGTPVSFRPDLLKG